MKKRCLILLISLFCFIPTFVYGATGSISIKCDSNLLVAGDSTNCIISGSSDEEVTAISASLNASNITFVSFTPSSKWVGDDISNGKIDIYTADDISGNFEIGTLKIKVNDGVYNIDDSVELKDVLYYNSSYSSYNVDSASFNIKIVNNDSNDNNDNSNGNNNDNSAVNNDNNSDSNNTITNPKTGQSYVVFIIFLLVISSTSIIYLKNKRKI